MRKSKVYSLGFLEACLGSVPPEVKAAACSQDTDMASSPSVRLYMNRSTYTGMMRLINKAPERKRASSENTPGIKEFGPFE
jgi:hypothetical protein